MTGFPTTRSGHCAREAHQQCPHYAGLEGRVSLWHARRPSEWTFVVCDCDCHASCALAGQRTVRRVAWRERCSCPGADRVRGEQERAEQRRRELAQVLDVVRGAGQWDAATVESRLRAVFAAHGEPPPFGLTGASRLLAAAHARPGTRTVRLLWMAARGLAGTLRWAWQPAGADNDSARNRATARAGYRTVAVLAAASAVATVVAFRSDGRRRRWWAFLATLTWLVSGWAGLLVSGTSQLARFTERSRMDRPDQADSMGK